MQEVFRSFSKDGEKKKRWGKGQIRIVSLIIITVGWQSEGASKDSARQPKQKAHLLLVSLNNEALI